MKILLSTTPSEGQFNDWTTPKHFESYKVNKYMPLGILSLATNIKGNHEIKVIDPASDNLSIEKTISIIEKENPDIFGLSTPTRRVYAMKEILQNIDIPYIAVGGPHATYYSKQILDLGADASFIGQVADLEFNKAIETKQKGIIYCNTNINDISFPKRDFLNIKDYFPKEFALFKSNFRLPMFTSVGCPNRCNFCNVQTKKVQYKNSDIIIKEMEYLKSLGCGSIHILDDNFNISENHVKGILDKIEKRELNMEWSGRGQTKMDYSLLERMAKDGFKRIHVGIEALDDKILKFFNKNEKYVDILHFCDACVQNNIDILGYFIIGSPVETKEYRLSLLDRIESLGITYPFLNILYPEPNTEYYNQLLRDGIYKRDYWKEYMENPTPDYELPYPYGEEKKEEIFNFVDDCIDRLKK